MAATLRLYNTLTRTKEPFVPIDPANVRMYACGPTVYDDAHIGNARPIIVFDLLFRLLRHLYGPDRVTYVRNVTDVDDKINARAAERGITIRELTDGTLARFHEDIRALGVLMPEDVNEKGRPPRMVEPRATDHVEEMRALIERLVASGHAYVAEDHVLFHVPSMGDYGALSKRPLDEMEAGARVDVAPYKRSPLDFVLWKPSGPRDPSWPSPAGIAVPGRPGWHIECSAMAWRHLGETFDIHAGGIDLVFPHHENEIAQSRCAFETPAMANVWLHNGFLQVEGEKMAKSAGNFVTIRELLSDWPGEVLRFNMLKTHYRQPTNWTLSGLDDSFDSYFDLLELAEEYVASTPDSDFLASLADDMNSPRAIARLYSLREEARAGDIDAGATLTASLQLVGLAIQSREAAASIPTISQGASEAQLVEAFSSRFPKNYPLGRAREVLKRSDLSLVQDEVSMFLHLTRLGSSNLRMGDLERLSSSVEPNNRRIETRNGARAAKNWAESDRIRDELAAMGIALKDNKDGTTTWEVARPR